jgi:hypothetical protein
MSVMRVSTIPILFQVAETPSDEDTTITRTNGVSQCTPVSHPAGRRSQPSKDRWEDLKPYIRRVYMEENKTLQQLAEVLRDEFEFFPT